MMNAINALLTKLFAVLVGPFAAAPLSGLLVWSIITGVAMTYVFGKTSNQRALKQVADVNRANLLAIKLFKHDLGVTFRCQVHLLKAAGLRLWLSVPPMLVMIVPLLVLLCQLAVWYEHQSLQPGDSTVVELQLAKSAWMTHRDVELVATDGVHVETDALRDAEKQTIYWRVRPESATLAAPAQPALLRWQVGEQTIEKTLAVSQDAHRLAPVGPRRPGAGIIDRLFHPTEPGFDRSGPVRAVVVHHPPRQNRVLGMNVPWWATFFVVSIVTALVTGRLIGVRY